MKILSSDFCEANAISQPISSYFTRCLIHMNLYDLTRTISVLGRFRGGLGLIIRTNPYEIATSKNT